MCQGYCKSKSFFRDTCTYIGYRWRFYHCNARLDTAVYGFWPGLVQNLMSIYFENFMTIVVRNSFQVTLLTKKNIGDQYLVGDVINH